MRQAGRLWPAPDRALPVFTFPLGHFAVWTHSSDLPAHTSWRRNKASSESHEDTCYFNSPTCLELATKSLIPLQWLLTHCLAVNSKLLHLQLDNLWPPSAVATECSNETRPKGTLKLLLLLWLLLWLLLLWLLLLSSLSSSSSSFDELNVNSLIVIQRL